MYSDLYSSDWSELFKLRLQKIEKELRGLTFSTREEYQAAVYARLNQMFALGNRMTPLRPVLRQGPATVGDVQTNLQLLNDDASAIVNQLTATEQTASRLLNLYAATQNSLRQQIREVVYQPTNRVYVEGFVNGNNLSGTDGIVDFNAGRATLPLAGEKLIAPSAVRLGPATTNRDANDEGTLQALLDGEAETVMEWNGDTLELIFEFPAPSIVNRIRIEMDDYNGLTLAELTSSAEGTVRENILAEAGPEFQQLDGSSGKFTGDYILDFDPKHITQVRFLIKDRVGQRRIALRGITFFQRQYQNKALVQSKEIQSITGDCYFTASQHTAETLTSITHMLSEDGVHYRVIVPDSQVQLPARFFYRALLERLDGSFETAGGPVDTDPSALDPATKISGVQTVDLGGGIVERTITLSSVVGGLLLKETPLPKTLIVTSGMISVMPESSPAAIGVGAEGPNVVTFQNNKLTFLYEVSGVSVKYQTSALGAAGLSARKPYYSPCLYEVRFERN